MHTRASARSERRQSGVFAQSFLRHLREGETRDSAKCSRIPATTLQPPGPLEYSRPALALCNASLAFAFTGRSGRRGLVLHDLRLGLVRRLLRQAEVSVRAFLDRLQHCTGWLRLHSDDREPHDPYEFTGA
jgi:hypothetical protein